MSAPLYIVLGESLALSIDKSYGTSLAPPQSLAPPFENKRYDRPTSWGNKSMEKCASSMSITMSMSMSMSISIGIGIGINIGIGIGIEHEYEYEYEYVYE